MQLRGAALLLLLAWPAAAVAQTPPRSSARARGMLYQDSDQTTVVTSAVEAQAVIEDTVALRGGYVADVVSTASVDVVAAATQRWDERRDEARGAAELYVDDVTLGAGYVHSQENDYESHRITAGGSLSLAQRSTTLSLGLGLILSEVGRADDPSFHADQRIYALNAAITQVLTPDTLGTLGYGVQLVDGYQASPYRYVRSDAASYVSERHPLERWRHAFTGRLRHSLADEVALGIDERVYYDNWDVFGTTTVLRLTFTVADEVDLALRDRFHFQTAAFFYEPTYTEQREFMTVDRELSMFVDNYVGPALVVRAEDVGFLSSLTFDLSADFFAYHFFDHPWITERYGVLVSLGLEGRL